jgi:sentrin-specific protease 8
LIGDVSLSREDVALLVPPRWINDQIITAAFELLRTRTHPGDERFYAVGASEAFMMAQLDDSTQLSALFASLKLETRELVLLPVSDHDEPDAAGGTHWSLLAFYRCGHHENFYHFDSLMGINFESAAHLARRVAPLLGARDARVLVGPTPQQQNGYDCGMYAIVIAELCAGHVGEEVGTVAELIAQLVTPAAIQHRRKEFIRLLQQMLGEAEDHATDATAGRSSSAADAAPRSDEADRVI